MVFRGTMNASFQSGSTIEDKGFGSTTTSWTIARGFRMSEREMVAIRVPAGAKAIGVNYVTGSPSSENEILFARGSRYRVTDEVITKTRLGKKSKFRVLDLLPPERTAAPTTYGPSFEPSGQGTLFKSAASEEERLRDKYSWGPGDVTLRPTTQAENDEADANVQAASKS